MDTRPAPRRCDWSPIHGLIFIALTAAALCVPPLRYWPLPMVVPLLAYFGLVALIPVLRTSFLPWRAGRISGSAGVATLVIGLGSCGVLVAFHLLTRPDVSFLRGSLPVTTAGGVVAAGVLFSVLNALLEESIFRGIFFDAIRPRWGAAAATLVPAIAFGYFHMHGYPPGLLGAVLAGIYGVCLGWLRVFSGGLLWPVLAHIAADATIFVLLAREGAL